jgi:hypothetical protein
MAELADAADSKSAEGNLVGVRPPLPAPIKQRDQVNLASPERRGQNRLVAADFHWESDHGTFVTSQRALDYLIATRVCQHGALAAGFSSPSPSFGKYALTDHPDRIVSWTPLDWA